MRAVTRIESRCLMGAELSGVLRRMLDMPPCQAKTDLQALAAYVMWLEDANASEDRACKQAYALADELAQRRGRRG